MKFPISRTSLKHFAPISLSWPSFFGCQVYGTSAGGDADELRLLSTSSTFINLRAYGGSLDFVSTKVRFLCTFGSKSLRNVLCVRVFAFSAFVIVCVSLSFFLPIGIRHIQWPCRVLTPERHELCGHKLRDR